jgi:hypothetical protein
MFLMKCLFLFIVFELGLCCESELPATTPHEKSLKEILSIYKWTLLVFIAAYIFDIVYDDFILSRKYLRLRIFYCSSGSSRGIWYLSNRIFILVLDGCRLGDFMQQIASAIPIGRASDRPLRLKPV